MSQEETLESKLADLQDNHQQWLRTTTNTQQEEELKQKVLDGLEKDIDRIQQQIQSNNND